MATLRAATRVTADSGFRPEVVEKVLRLRGILPSLEQRPTIRGAEPTPTMISPDPPTTGQKTTFSAGR